MPGIVNNNDPGSDAHPLVRLCLDCGDSIWVLPEAWDNPEIRRCARCRTRVLPGLTYDQWLHDPNIAALIAIDDLGDWGEVNPVLRSAESYEEWSEQRNECDCGGCWSQISTYDQPNLRIVHRRCAAPMCGSRLRRRGGVEAEGRARFCAQHQCAEPRQECMNGVTSIVGGAGYCDEHEGEALVEEERRQREVAYAGLIQYYSTKPYWNIHGSDPHDLYLGIEIEVERRRNLEISRGELASWVIDAFGESQVLCKSDGSLNDGFEIVYHPRSLGSWQEMEIELEALNMRLRGEGGLRSWDANTNSHPVGIHVHASKAALVPESEKRKSEFWQGDNSKLSSRHVWMIQSLLYNNREHAAAFAGRDVGYGSLDLMRLGGQGSITRVTKGLKEDGNCGQDDRSMAVNFQPEETVEFRMFRGSLNTTRILANVEFVHALITYTRGVTFADYKDFALDWSVFMNWLRKAERYPHAHKVLDRVNRFVDTNA